MAIIVTAGAGDTCCIMGQRHIQTINREKMDPELKTRDAATH